MAKQTQASIATVSNAQAQNILRAVWFTPGLNDRWGLPVLLWGDPGTGKTSGLRARAGECGLWSHVLLGSITDPTDFGGTPTAPTDTADRFDRRLLPGWLKGIDAKGGAGVLILDELTTVSPSQQAAMLRLVLDGAIGDYTLSPRVRFVAAANYVDQAAGGNPLTMPLANRFGHLSVEVPAIDDWLAILSGDRAANVQPLNADAVEAEVLAQWPQAFDRALAYVGAFLRKFPDLAQQTPRAGSAAGEAAWSSRRSWEAATRALAGAEIHGLDADERDLLVASFIGESAAVQFAAWIREQDVPDVEALLDGTAQWTPSPYRPDRSALVLDLCYRRVKADCDSQSSNAAGRARTLWNLLASVANTPDVGARVLNLLSNLPQAAAQPEAMRARMAYHDYLRATGVR